MEKLSPQQFSIILKISEFLENKKVKFKEEWNNLEIQDDIDWNLFTQEVEELLKELDFVDYQIDEIDFFIKKVLVIRLKLKDGKEEYVKVFYNKWFKYYKRKLVELFGLN